MIYGPLYFTFHNCDIFIGPFFAISSISLFIAQNIWGTLFDKYPQPLKFIFFGILSNSILLFISWIFLSPNIIVILFSLIMFLGSMYLPAIQATITILFPDKKGKKLGELLAYESIGWGCGSLSGIILFSKLSINNLDILFKLAFFFNTVIFILIKFLPKIKLNNNFNRKNNKNLKEIFKSQYYFVKKHQNILIFSLLLLSVCSVNTMFFSHFGIYFTTIVKGTTSQLSISLLLATILGFLSYPIYGKLGDKYGSIYILKLSLLLYFINFFIISVIKNIFLIMIVYAWPLYPGLRIAGNIFISNHTKKNERGTGLGLIESIHAFGAIIGPILSSIIIKLSTYEILPKATTVITFIIFLITIIYYKKSEKAYV